MSASQRAASFFLTGGLSWAAGSSALKLQPYTGFNFLVELDGLIVGGFSKVSGLAGEIRTESFVEGGRHHSPHVLLGETSWPPLVLERGLTDLDTLWSWFEATDRGVLRPKDGIIMLLDRQRSPAMFWEFRQALPVKWEGPQLSASGAGSVAVERLTLMHQGLQRPAWHKAVSATRLGLALRGA